MILRNIMLAAFFAGSFAIAQDAKKDEQKPVKEEQDPVCGMMVDTAKAPKTAYKGKTYYFCSIDEKNEFDKAPATYIKVEKKETTKK